MRFKTRNLPWLIALGALIGVVIFSGAATGLPAIGLLGLYAGAVVLSSVRLRPVRIRAVRRADVPRALTTAPRNISPDARAAIDRARRRGGVDSDFVLADVGLIATQRGPDGITMTRTNDPTADDDGVRPYVTLRVPPREADRTVRIRFEMTDGTGETRYVHEMRTLLRDGEISVLADHHLPLSGGDVTPGDWDLRVSVEGLLVGMHGFRVIPSTRDRLAYLRAEQPRRGQEESGARGRRLSGADDSVPMSLEDLLRQQSGSARSNGSASRRDSS